MKSVTYNQSGKESGDITLPKDIFEVEPNLDLLHQVVYVQTANRRRKIAKSKDRSEVRGGGKKPWAQKGTGRARHGSTRSPIWVGGGTTFGPLSEKVLKKEIPNKMKRKALFMALSSKLKEKQLFVIDDILVEKPKTKEIFNLLNKLFENNGSALFALATNNDNAIKSIRNIQKTKVMQARELNVLDILSSKYLIIEKSAVDVIKETFVK